jgi:hypothetical protein
VSRYRDALVRGAPPDELAALAQSLDPESVTTLHWMRETARATLPKPDPLFAHRLERELRRGFSPSATDPVPRGAGPPPSGDRVSGPPPGGPPRPLPPPAARSRANWQPLAVAAVLLLVLTGALIAYRQAAVERPHTVLVGAGDAHFETLVHATVEGAATTPTAIAIERWRMQPGGAVSIPPVAGPQWVVAEDGPLVAAVDGARRSLAPGQGVVIAAGKRLELRNTGLNQVAVLRGVAASGFSLETYDRDLVSRETALDTEAHESLPPGTSRIVFDRLTLPPDASITLEPATGQDWMAVVSGTLGLTLTGDTVPRGWTSGREREMTASDAFPILVPGTAVTLRNLGEEPLVLLRLRVTPL